MAYNNNQAKSIAETLNNHFCSIGSKLVAQLKSGGAQNNQPTQVSTKQDVDEFHFDPIDELFVCNQLSKLKASKATGLDRNTARLLKDAVVQINPVVTNLFNRSLLSSTFPSAWKSRKVVPLYKSGNRCNPSNYRLITVLPTASKILEKAIHTQVYRYLLQHKILSPRQFGFRPELSSEVALTDFADFILGNMDKGCVTGQFFWICQKLLTP